MDNVACYGSEDKLIDCSYHTDTTEDDHSNDIWINCDTTEQSATEQSTTEQSTDQSQLTAIAGLGLSLILLVIIIVVIVFLVIIALVLYKHKKRTYTTER